MRINMNRQMLVLLLAAGICLLNAINLDEAKQMALNNNSSYLAQKNSYEASKWSKQQALSGLFPSLTASGSYVYLDPATTVTSGPEPFTLNHDSRSAALTLSQPIFMGGKLWQAYRISSISSEMSRLALENMRLTILNDVESKYLNVLQLQELLAIAEKDLLSSDQNFAIARVRFDNGTLSRGEFLKIQAKKASKEVALIQAQNALDLSRQDFFNTIDSGEDSLFAPVFQSADTILLDKLSELSQSNTDNLSAKALRYSREHNLSLKITDKSVKLSERAYSIAKGNFLPTVLLSASRSFRENGIDRYEFDATNTLALTASVPLLPLWNNYAGTRKAYYDMQKSRMDYQTADSGITLAVRSSALNLISSARQVKAAEIALQYTEQTYQQLMERFRNNMLSATEMLDAEVMLQAAQVSYTNSLYSFYKAKATLLQALGTDDVNIINTLMD